MSAVQESELPEVTRAHTATAGDGADEPSTGGVADVELLFDALGVPAARAEAERVFERAAARGLFGEREAVAVLERRRVAALVAAGRRAHPAGAQQQSVHLWSMCPDRSKHCWLSADGHVHPWLAWSFLWQQLACR